MAVSFPNLILNTDICSLHRTMVCKLLDLSALPCAGKIATASVPLQFKDCASDFCSFCLLLSVFLAQAKIFSCFTWKCLSGAQSRHNPCTKLTTRITMNRMQFHRWLPPNSKFQWMKHVWKYFCRVYTRRGGISKDHCAVKIATARALTWAMLFETWTHPNEAISISGVWNSLN